MSLNKNTIRGYKVWWTRTDKMIKEEEDLIALGLGSKKVLKALKRNLRFYGEKIDEEKKESKIRSTKRK